MHTTLLLKQAGNELDLITSTDPNATLEDSAVQDLASLTISSGFERSFAGSNHDINLRENVWDIAVSLEKDGEGFYILYFGKTDKG